MPPHLRSWILGAHCVIVGLQLTIHPEPRISQDRHPVPQYLCRPLESPQLKRGLTVFKDADGSLAYFGSRHFSIRADWSSCQASCSMLAGK